MVWRDFVLMAGPLQRRLRAQAMPLGLGNSEAAAHQFFVNPKSRIPMAATLTVDTTGQIRTWSREAEELLGYSGLEAVGQSVEIIIPPHLRDRHWAGFGRFVQTGISVVPQVVTTLAVHKTRQLLEPPISV